MSALNTSLQIKCSPVCTSPDEVTAEDEAQDENEDARAEDDHVDVEGQVLEGDGRHGARLVGVNQSQTTEAPCTETEGALRTHSLQEPIRGYESIARRGRPGKAQKRSDTAAQYRDWICLSHTTKCKTQTRVFGKRL